SIKSLFLTFLLSKISSLIGVSNINLLTFSSPFLIGVGFIKNIYEVLVKYIAIRSIFLNTSLLLFNSF
ncbi:hypothetical protein OFM52_31305, partial [Escherichia coli]|nr:hypothetical protein [Escherichia coli]